MNIQKTISLRLLATGLLFLAAPLAFAHDANGQTGGLVAGLMHPVSGFDHVLAMIAVGLWGAVLGAPAIWVLPIAFPMVMAMGGLMGLLGIPLPGIEIGIALSAIIIGAMVFGRVRPPLFAAALVVAVFALFHGHAHGSELPAGADALLYSAGFVVSTGVIHLVGIAIGALDASRTGRHAVRGAAAGIMAGGAFFLWQAMGV